jgi:hypothetical protein
MSKDTKENDPDRGQCSGDEKQVPARPVPAPSVGNLAQAAVGASVILNHNLVTP